MRWPDSVKAAARILVVLGPRSLGLGRTDEPQRRGIGVSPMRRRSPSGSNQVGEEKAAGHENSAAGIGVAVGRAQAISPNGSARYVITTKGAHR
jgi:hypothetical protein